MLKFDFNLSKTPNLILQLFFNFKWTMYRQIKFNLLVTYFTIYFDINSSRKLNRQTRNQFVHKKNLVMLSFSNYLVYQR